ncbi:uncharacterized protein EI90DRAFT_3155738 [Cantharellus anzutake]|uniref:uncharacterized protein n=1 Tax=Cantharellus anzutake TaxID=1750568 RepID=UPI0019070E08|nr:uncharacterized protein EI90DRAFT_3155738 [Cantharellus anzutake]KAF8328344.1 hypothetical protein EI90DRAFT_3155738 [Cantharellus anzutake]
MAGGPGGAVGGLGGLDNDSLLWTIIMAPSPRLVVFSLGKVQHSLHFPIAPILRPYDTGTIGGVIAMKDWLNVFGSYDPSIGQYLKTNDKSLVVSILSAGTFFGALISFPLGDLIGRKYGLICSCVIFSVGVGLQLSTNWATFIAGRVVAGLGGEFQFTLSDKVFKLDQISNSLIFEISNFSLPPPRPPVGAVSCLVPMYQSECSPKKLRGLIVGLYQFAITIGALLAAIVLNATKNQNSHSSWRTPIAVQFVWAAILGGGMLALPESPRYLLYKNNWEAARYSLSRLILKPENSPEVDTELAEISLALEAERALGGNTYLDCFKFTANKNFLRTMTGIWLQAWQQLTGINFIFYYGTTFFKSAGISNSFIITIICDVVNTCMTIVGVQLIDRVGRRKLMIIGAIGMMVCEYIVAIVGVTAGKTHFDVSTGLSQAVSVTAQRVLIAFVCFYISFYAISWGPVAWVLTGEIFPLAIRAKGMSLAVASNWLWNFGIGYATPYLVDPSTTGVNAVKAANLGVKVFFIWGSTCAGCFLFAYLFIPETKGLSLEQIDLLYRESSVIRSNAYRRRMLEAGETFLHHDLEHVDVDKRDFGISGVSGVVVPNVGQPVSKEVEIVEKESA